MFNDMIFTYITTNLVNGKRYVGSHRANDFNDGYLGSGRLIQNAIKKYGKNNFIREILCLHDSSDEAYRYEGVFINGYCTLFPHGYNLSPTGGFLCSGRHHEEYGKEAHNRMKMEYKKGIRRPWSLGLTKEDHPSIMSMSNKLIGRKLSDKNKRLAIYTLRNSKGVQGYRWTEKQRLKKSKAIYQYDLDGSFIKEWGGSRLAAEKLGISGQAITHCVNGRIKSSGGFIWRYQNGDAPEETKPMPVKGGVWNKGLTSRNSKGVRSAAIKRGKPILQCDKSGNLIEEWCTISEAARFIGAGNSGICQCLKNKMPSYKGYIWKYKSNG